MATMVTKTHMYICLFLLFLFLVCPIALCFFDCTLTFEDRLITGHISPAYRRIYYILAGIRKDIYIVLSQCKNIEEIKLLTEKNKNNIRSYIQKYREMFPPDIYQNFGGISNSELVPSVISFYVTGEKSDVWWIGYNLCPPHLKGRFGLDRASRRARRDIEKWAITQDPNPRPFLYGSSSIDVPPISDDVSSLYKEQDTVVWLRISPVKFSDIPEK